MANTTGKSLLLSCGPEIRNIIYGYALSYEGALNRGEPEKANLISPALLQVSKSVEREAAPIFYERNLFRFNCGDLEICREQNLDANKHLQAESLSSYDDARMTCPNIGVPKRYLKSLRKVYLFRKLDDMDSKSLWFIDFWVLDLENAINYLAARNVILSQLWIVLQKRFGLCELRWGPDPASLLRELDAEKRISTAVGKFANLSRLNILSYRVSHRPPGPRMGPFRSKAAPPIDVNRVKLDHFARAQAVIYTRQEGMKVMAAHSPTVYCLTEMFLISLKRWKTGTESRSTQVTQNVKGVMTTQGGMTA